MTEAGELARELEQLRRERDYFKRHADELTGAAVKRDYEISTLRHSLKQRQQGFALLSELQRFIGGQSALYEIFCHTAGAINATLGMDKTFVLTRSDRRGGEARPPAQNLFTSSAPANGFHATTFRTEVCMGTGSRNASISLDASALQSGASVVVNGAAPHSALRGEVHRTFDLPHFVLQPVLVSGETLAVLLTGRMVEKRPFAPPLDAGDADTLESIAALIAAFVLNRQSAALREDNAQLRHLATIDKLTGIPNRRHFEETLAIEWKRAMRNRTPLAAILLDVDHFKNCNDTYGHDAGDAILQQVAQRVNDGLRPGDVGARYGGEEFVILLPETETAGAVAVAERVRASIEATPMRHMVTPEETRQTASFGVASLMPTDEVEPRELVSRADTALYEAKHGGRNRVCAMRLP